MEVRTSDVYKLLDDLRIGVKSLSNLAMAGSCGNMPQYSHMQFINEVEDGWSLQSRKATELFPTPNALIA